MRHQVSEQLGSISKNFITRWAFVLAQMGGPMSLVRVSRLDHFATKLTLLQKKGKYVFVSYTRTNSTWARSRGRRE